MVLASRDAEKLEALGRGISVSGGRAIAIKTDVSDAGSVDALVRETLDAFGSLDVLVNNAGLGLSGRVANLRAEDLRYVFEVNTVGPLKCTQAALPHMGRGGAHHQRLLGRRQARDPKGRWLLRDQVRPERALGRPARRDRRSCDHGHERVPRYHADPLQGQLQAHRKREARLAPAGGDARRRWRPGSPTPPRRAPATFTSPSPTGSSSPRLCFFPALPTARSAAGQGTSRGLRGQRAHAARTLPRGSRPGARPHAGGGRRGASVLPSGSSLGWSTWRCSGARPDSRSRPRARGSSSSYARTPDQAPRRR